MRSSVVAVFLLATRAWSWVPSVSRRITMTRVGRYAPRSPFGIPALSESYLENDIVGVVVVANPETGQPDDDKREGVKKSSSPRLCVVREYGVVLPLCQHEDDAETDLYIDPRCVKDAIFQELTDDDITGTYGEGWYGQRPVPSLGGGPGYGADADEIWTVSEDVLKDVANDGVFLPILDVGIAHGEKARGGAY